MHVAAGWGCSLMHIVVATFTQQMPVWCGADVYIHNISDHYWGLVMHMLSTHNPDCTKTFVYIQNISSMTTLTTSDDLAQG